MTNASPQTQPTYFVSIGAGSVRKPAIVGPNGNIIAVATSPANAAAIAAAMNASAGI